MRLDLKHLKHLVVETQSGAMLGHIHDVIVETDGQLILQYAVKSSLLSSKEYLIHREQVARFEASKMIVVDGAGSSLATDSSPEMPMSPKPVAMRKIGRAHV